MVYLLPKDFGFGYRWLVCVGLACAALGLLVWIAGFASLGKRLAVFPGAESLATGGIYRWFRHPVYLGITLNLLGMFLACGSVIGLAYLVLVVLPLNRFRAKKEEKALIEKFGDAYRVYRDRTFF